MAKADTSGSGIAMRTWRALSAIISRVLRLRDADQDSRADREEVRDCSLVGMGFCLPDYSSPWTGPTSSSPSRAVSTATIPGATAPPSA
eukprot:2711600-Pyramimonas_sp.AAC.1